MLGPPLPPAVDQWTDGDQTTTTAAWRERERRQRSVRLLMMFLLMLLLMDGEEHQARQRRDYLRKKSTTQPLEDEVYRARLEQDDAVLKATRTHARYQALVERNGGTNVESSVRKWAEQQQEMQKDTFDAKAQVGEDPENEKTVFHYPWNATGFYRGGWVREGVADEDGDKEEEKVKPTEEKSSDKEKNSVEKKEPEKLKALAPIDLEKPMTDLLMERDERIGVFLLPQGLHVKMDNFTELKNEKAAAQAAAQSLRDLTRKSPSSPFLRLSHPELNVLHEETFEEEADSTPHVTLTKPSGRAAFQFFSRSIPAMKELSLVDGFIKLYDSNTAGYSTRRDILLRVRGVMIHSIGRLSLVSNASPGRSAFVALDTKQTENDKDNRRLLEESMSALDDGDTDSDVIEQIRDSALDLHKFEDLEMEDSGWMITSLDELSGRRLTDEIAAEVEAESLKETASAKESSDDSPRTLSDALRGETKVEAAEIPTIAASKPQKASSSPPKATAVKSKSRIVVPYPFVPDDEHESIRKAKTPLSRRMPPREQLLEVNAGRCEFEVNLDVSEVEWSLGQWRTLMTRLVRETSLLDPSILGKEPDEKDEDDVDDEEEDGTFKTTHMQSRRKHGPPTVRSHQRSRMKPIQVQALVMTLLGEIHSPNCDFTSTLNATAIRTDWEHTTGKAINYSFYMMLACLVQIVVLLRQLLHTQSQSAATRVSLLSVGWQAVVDALVCIAHIYLSLVIQPLFTAFASVAFFKLLIFCVIEMKYMAIIIQARNNANGGQNTTELLRRQVAMLHLRFYVGLVASLLAFFYAGSEYRTIYILALYSFWVPQIIQNIITEAKRPLHTHYIYGMSLARLLAPLYIFGVPNNFLKEVYPDAPTNVFMCELLVVWVGIQTAVLIAQGKYGARFLIPARFLPPKFDYSRPIPASMLPPGASLDVPLSEGTLENEHSSEVPALIPSESTPSERHSTGVARNRIKGSRAASRPESMTTEAVQPGVEPPTLDCVICYNGVDLQNRKGYMLAPCNHIFHRECLMQWMDVKMQCPICREDLPAL